MDTDLEIILKELETKLDGRTVILGIGNPIRGDDAFGSALVKKIDNRVCFKVYDGGTSPENFLGKILGENPQTVLLIDTVDFGGMSGEIRLLGWQEIKTANFFLTHNPSPRLIFDFLQENIEAEFYLLAIQPKNIGLGEKMSQEIVDKLEELTCWFIEKYPADRK